MKLLIRSKILFLTMVCMTWLKTYAVVMPPAEEIDTTAAINAIRAEYKRINTASLTREVFSYEADGCVDGGQVQYFFNQQKDIVKIVESGSIGDGSWNREFCFQSGKFIFCYEVLVGGPAIGPETKTEYRTYIKDDQIIRFMDDKNIIPPGETASDALKISYRLFRLIRPGNSLRYCVTK